MNQFLTFEQAKVALQQGKIVKRIIWGDAFLFNRPADTFNISILLSLKSLPKSVKDYYEAKYQPIINANDVKITFEEFTCYCEFIYGSKDSIIYNGWQPFGADSDSRDWIIVELTDIIKQNNE